MSLNFDVEFDLKKLQKHLVIPDSKINELGDEILVALADKFLELVREKSPRKTGNYAASWHRTEPENNIIEIIQPDGKLFNILEFTGRRKLHIVPRKAKVLHFKINGEDVFVMWSNPSATQPEPHARPAMEEMGTHAKFLILDLISKKFPAFIMR